MKILLGAQMTRERSRNPKREFVDVGILQNPLPKSHTMNDPTGPTISSPPASPLPLGHWTLLLETVSTPLEEAPDGTLTSFTPTEWHSGQVIRVTNGDDIHLRGTVNDQRALLRGGRGVEVHAHRSVDGITTVASAVTHKDRMGHRVVREVPWTSVFTD